MDSEEEIEDLSVSESDDNYLPSSSSEESDWWEDDLVHEQEGSDLAPVPLAHITPHENRETIWNLVSYNEDTGPPPPPARFPFRGVPGVTYMVEDHAPCLSFLERFFDENLMGSIAEETNRFATQSAASDWKNVTSHELWTFLAVTLLQSIVKKPEIQQYWSRDPLIHTPIFSEIFPLRRYKKIQQYLHFSNNEEYDSDLHPSPKLNKIWPVLSNLVEKFKTLYMPERDVAIDESLLLFKGNLGWVQYMPLKRARFGMKSFVLCESSSGYVWNMSVYTGKGTVLDPEYASLPISSQVVMSLMKPLLNKGYCLTLDNFYSSPGLGDMLVQKQTDVYGTVRANRRDMPKDEKEVKNKGDVASYTRNKLTVIKWQDKKTVNILSSIHNEEMIDLEYKRGPRVYTKKKPKAIADYNETMGGVDLCDQRLSFYPVPRKRGKKYYKKIFFHLFDITVWNSFVLYQKSGGKSTHLQYRLQVIKGILEKHRQEVEFPNTSQRPMTSPSPLRLCGRHFPSTLPPNPGKERPTRRCFVCSRQNKSRRETRYYCSDCHTSLCIDPCFRVFHTAKVL